MSVWNLWFGGPARDGATRELDALLASDPNTWSREQLKARARELRERELPQLPPGVQVNVTTSAQHPFTTPALSAARPPYLMEFQEVPRPGDLIWIDENGPWVDLYLKVISHVIWRPRRHPLITVDFSAGQLDLSSLPDAVRAHLPEHLLADGLPQFEHDDFNRDGQGWVLNDAWRLSGVLR